MTVGHVSDPCCPVLTAGEEVVLVCPGEGQVSQLQILFISFLNSEFPLDHFILNIISFLCNI